MTLADKTREGPFTPSRCSVLSDNLLGTSTNRSIIPRRVQSFNINHQTQDLEALVNVSFFYILSFHSFYFYSFNRPDLDDAFDGDASVFTCIRTSRAVTFNGPQHEFEGLLQAKTPSV